MLQRAASNAYSWWAASHIRTKQSKWLEQSLQDMQEKVESVVKLIEEDGDSFAKRAEMYYKKRPELINFVEESYRAYRSLAERYDHLSKELQAANNTIAAVFPEQIQLAMEEEDEYGAPKVPKTPRQIPTSSGSKVPKAPIKQLKGLITTASKKLKGTKSIKKEDTSKNAPKSGLQKNEALEEIDKLQKDILALQTVKEFVKSSYESGLTKYKGIESQIMEKQQKICKLEDEFGEGRTIDDNDARTLMAEAALKSCQETLSQLQEKQERSTKDAINEFKKVEDASNKLKSIKHKYLGDQIDETTKAGEKDNATKTSVESQSLSQELSKEIKSLQDKIKEQFDVSSMASLTVTELAEKIDELVSEVVSLETAVSAQTVLIDRLRSESDDLQSQLQVLENDKETTQDDKQNVKIKMTDMEDKLYGIQNLNKDVEHQNNSFQTYFATARSSLDCLAEKLSTVKPDEEIQDEEEPVGKVKSQEGPRKQEVDQSESEGAKNLCISKTEDQNVRKEGEVKETTKNRSDSKISEPTQEEKVDEKVSSLEAKSHEDEEEKGDDPNWEELLSSRLEDREKTLLAEYTTVLRNYKEIKKKLSDREKKDRDTEFEVTLQMRELRSAIAKRDEEINNLRGKLNVLQKDVTESKALEEEKQQQKSEDVVETDEKDNQSVIKMMNTIDEHSFPSPIEEKFRMEIDSMLDENLDFWLRFSSTFHQIQKFKTTVQDLQSEITKLREKETEESNNTKPDMKSEIRPIYKHMREIQNELSVWLDQSVPLKDEMKRRSSSLCRIQEEITKALKEGVEEDEIMFSSHQAAKFQGEVSNMKQENKKVKKELEVGVDHITTLQGDVENTVTKLEKEFGLATTNQQQVNNSAGGSIPLRSFIFGTKPKKQRRSVFSSFQNNRKALWAGVPL